MHLGIVPDDEAAIDFAQLHKNVGISEVMGL